MPWDRPTRTYVRHGFHLYDAKAAIVTTELGMAFLADSVHVAHYEQRFAELEAACVFGEQAREVFRRLADEYRGL